MYTTLAFPLNVSFGQTALDAYVAKFDASYSWSKQNTINGTGYTTYIVDMTSQTWRSPSEVDRTEWDHWLTVVVPDGAVIDTAMLYISGGDNGGGAPGDDSQLASAAVETHSVMARLRTVPNQTLQFSDLVGSRREDGIIAYTFDKYLNGGDDEWPALLPMVKSVVRAMDTIEMLVADETEGATTVNDFTLYGVSKRGWTTWLTAAVDDRVSAIAPAVIDVLNMGPQMQHHKQFYEGVTDQIVGGYSWVLDDYVEYDIPDNLDTPEAAALLAIVDPYEYRDRYADIPKMMINATGDEFFVPNSSHLYFDDLPGDKYLRYKPNSGHSGDFDAAALFHVATANGDDLPEFTWTLEDGGTTIRVNTTDTPLEVKMWEAHNPDARDFRYSISTPPPVWTSELLSENAPGEYVAEVDYPMSGATAFMVELTFASGYSIPYVFTTEVSVVDLPAPGDGNLDGVVDGLDYLLWAAAFGDNPAADPPGSPGNGDYNNDGMVDSLDYLVWAENYGTGSAVAVPEPTGFALAMGAVVSAMCGGRRRRNK
jgi:PhoPQ-activated pathogenicity-related protein